MAVLQLNNQNSKINLLIQTYMFAVEMLYNQQNSKIFSSEAAANFETKLKQRYTLQQTVQAL